MAVQGCLQAHEIVFGRRIRALKMENEILSATILLDQGADIHELIYKPRGVDVLFKPPYPAREPGVGPAVTGDSVAQWISHYRGGWQVIFPNFGPPVEYKGAPLDMHGEAARSPWELEEIAEHDGVLQVTMALSLSRTPFHMRRVMSLSSGRAVLSISETVVNWGSEAMECMWGHHPAFSAPLLAAGCRVTTGARAIWSDDGYAVPGNDILPGRTWAWPHVQDRQGRIVDLSQIPAPGSNHSRVLFLKDFAESWYALSNPTLGLGAGLVWDGELMPYACFWQETGGERGYPWYGRAYVTAIEPNSSYPGHGLPAVIAKTGTQLTLQPGESRTLSLKAVLFEGGRDVARIDAEGEVYRT